jgi:hypothetical protein
MDNRVKGEGTIAIPFSLPKLEYNPQIAARRAEQQGQMDGCLQKGRADVRLAHLVKMRGSAFFNRKARRVFDKLAQLQRPRAKARKLPMTLTEMMRRK